MLAEVRITCRCLSSTSAMWISGIEINKCGRKCFYLLNHLVRPLTLFMWMSILLAFTYMLVVPREQKRVLDPVEVVLEVVNHCVSAWTEPRTSVRAASTLN